MPARIVKVGFQGARQVAAERKLAVNVTHRELRNSSKWELVMSSLIAIIYPSEDKAEEVRKRLIELQNEYLLTLGDAVIATKTDAGKVKLNQLMNLTAAGAASGSFWGLLVGVLFLNPLIGVALGAASGAIGGALSDVGINDNFMKELARGLQPGNAALFVLVKEMTEDKVLKDISPFGGTILRTSLDESKEQLLRDALQKASAP
ncbi:putative membrane protein [Sinorhizobium meliloti]|nr:hypothetical protein BN406_04645 [Sinorhizobium meliloti Rm41]